MTHRILAFAAGMVLAGTAGAAATDARLPRLQLPYVSAFAGRPPPTDPPPIDWARSNALVGQLGGHAGHWRTAPAREAKP